MDADRVAPVRPVSATQRSGIDKALKDSVLFEKKIVETDVDFVSDGSVHDDFVKTVMKSLKAAKTESELQDGVFNAISALPETIAPPVSKRPPKEKDMKFWNKIQRFVQPTLYQERSMKSILDLYAKEYFEEMLDQNAVETMETAEPGLFVRATSRPDIAFVQKSGDVALGEIKNDDNFSVSDARMQEGAYLMLLLYWWKVYARREVATVYGFVLCGPFCRDMKQRKRTLRGKPATGARYCICLMKLDAPLHLGDIPCLSYFKGISSLEDDSTVRKLSQFLTKKDLWDKKGTDTINNPCPAWFSLPNNFARKLSSQTKWNLVANGTAAAVFRCSGVEGVQEIINLTDEEVQSMAALFWKAYLDEKEGEGELIFYVKVSTSAIDRSFTTPTVSTLRRFNDQDILRTYPVPEIFSDSCYCVLMADRGTRIPRSKKWALQRFNQMFVELRERTIAISKNSKYHHGDIAKHNIVIEKDSKGCEHFVLLDWDEARHHPKSRDSEGLIYLDLLHPEHLRQKPMLYTKVQLAILYWRLRKEHVESESQLVNWDEDTLIPGLEEYRDAVHEEGLIVGTATVFVSKAEAILTISRLLRR